MNVAEERSFVPLDPIQGELLFSVRAARYELLLTIVTTNLALTEGPSLP